jgi:hypothetical protein
MSIVAIKKWVSIVAKKAEFSVAKMTDKIIKWLNSLEQNHKMTEHYSNQKMTEQCINEEWLNAVVIEKCLSSV